MEDTYSPQAVNQARNSFKKKVRKASATFFYGAMCGFFTTDELDDLLFEASEVARFLLEVESTTLDIDEEIDIEDRITKVMRSVGEKAKTILKTRAEEDDSSKEIPGIPQQNSIVPDRNSRSSKKPADSIILQKKDEKSDTTATSDTAQASSIFSKSIFLVDGKNAMEGSIRKTENAEGISIINRMRKADENKPDLLE
jgi:hypothetical protein